MGEPPSNWRPYLGRKVSVRYTLDPASGYSASEALGVLQSVHSGDDGVDVIQILTRQGEVVVVRAPDVTHASIFPS
jgi:hypothetical protein